MSHLSEAIEARSALISHLRGAISDAIGLDPSPLQLAAANLPEEDMRELTEYLGDSLILSQWVLGRPGEVPEAAAGLDLSAHAVRIRQVGEFQVTEATPTQGRKPDPWDEMRDRAEQHTATPFSVDSLLSHAAGAIAVARGARSPMDRAHIVEAGAALGEALALIGRAKS